MSMQLPVGFGTSAQLWLALLRSNLSTFGILKMTEDCDGFKYLRKHLHFGLSKLASCSFFSKPSIDMASSSSSTRALKL